MASSKNIVWIASYPKSGNTWLRFIACNLLFGPQESAATLNTLAPDVHELVDPAHASAHAGLLKTHFLYSAQLPLAERTAGAIYVVRHPADVLVSNFHYSQRSNGSAQGVAESSDFKEAFDRYFETFLAHRGDPRWVRRGMGSWERNVRSWLQAGLPFPIWLVRYEELSADPLRVCGELAQALRPNCSSVEIRSAVENSSFRRMREIEAQDIEERRVGIFYKPYLQASIDAGNRFMRRGAVGDGLARLTEDQRQRVDLAFGPLLTELGYSAASTTMPPKLNT